MPVVVRRHTGPDVALFPDGLDSIGSRHFPTEQLWFGENPGVFLTEYLWDWQGLGYFLCFLLPGIIITYIICYISVNFAMSQETDWLPLLHAKSKYS